MTYNSRRWLRQGRFTLLNPARGGEDFFRCRRAGVARRPDVDTNFSIFADDVKRLQKQLDGSEREKARSLSRGV